MTLQVMTRNEQEALVFVDTCAFLDLVRLPFREGDFERELKAATLLQSLASTGNITLLASAVSFDEYARNEEKVIIELTNHVAHVSNAVKRLAAFSKLVGSGVMEWGVDDNLLIARTCEAGRSALAACALVETTDEDRLAAWSRHAKGIRPARHGKDSLGDCTIYASLIRSAEGFRRSSAGPIVFLTSNTKDFCSETHKGRPHEDIESDFGTLQISLVTGWAWASKVVRG